MIEIPKDSTVLLKFSASWCVNCKPLTEVVHRAALQTPVIEIDIDDEPELAQQYNVRGVPTLVLMKNGTEISRKVGSLTESQLKSFVD